MATRITKILGIAINEYDDKTLGDLDNPERDVTDIIQIITSRYNYEDLDFLSGREKTTRKNLYALLQDYITNATEGDSLLIIYAGHGKFDERYATTYWQTSDSDDKDAASWLNLNDVLAFMKISKASHIGIISDSCFAGGIFEKMRGGGTQAFDNKISREALTSGGIEKVSDGKKTENSPFAKDIIKILSENNDRQLPFISLSQKLILEFEKERKQTPQYGSLNNVGHSGGSLILELKDVPTQTEKKENLKPFFGKLFLPFLKENESDIEKLKDLVKEKTKTVKSQRYEAAAAIRDQELNVYEKISIDLKNYLASIEREIKLGHEEVESSRILNEQIIAYNNGLEEQKAMLIKMGKKFNMPFFGDEKDKPAIKYFHKQEKEMYAVHLNSLLELYKYFKKIKGQIKCEFLERKEDDLLKILDEIYSFQFQILSSPTMSNIRKEKRLSELNIKLLKWIDDD